MDQFRVNKVKLRVVNGPLKLTSLRKVTHLEISVSYDSYTYLIHSFLKQFYKNASLKFAKI